MRRTVSTSCRAALKAGQPHPESYLVSELLLEKNFFESCDRDGDNVLFMYVNNKDV